MSEYIILQTIPGQATALFLDFTNGTVDTIDPDDTVIIFAVEDGMIVRESLGDGERITSKHVFSAVGVQLLGYMMSFEDCFFFEAKRHPDGSISIGDGVIDPSSI